MPRNIEEDNFRLAARRSRKRNFLVMTLYTVTHRAGWLFKNESKSKTKDHLIILITPQIMRGAEERRAALTEEMRRRTEQIQNEWEKISTGEKDAAGNPAD